PRGPRSGRWSAPGPADTWARRSRREPKSEGAGVNRSEYAAVYGPTTGDRIVLADTGLVVEVEADAQRRGEEFLAGFGKTARDGLHLKAASVRETCDLVVSNVVIIDPVLGVRKA